MKFTILASALSFASAVLSAPSLGFEKRNPNGSFKLVAYGVDASATDFFYSDGISHQLTLTLQRFSRKTS